MVGGVTLREIMWTGGFPHQSGLPHLPGVPHFYVSRLLGGAAFEQGTRSKEALAGCEVYTVGSGDKNIVFSQTFFRSIGYSWDAISNVK